MGHTFCTRSKLQEAARREKSASAAEPPRPIIRTCGHILESGVFCRQSAVRGGRFCRAHRLLRVRCRRMVRARRRNGALQLPLLIDMRAIQTGLIRVRVALEAGRIDPHQARRLRWSPAMAAAGLRFIEWSEMQAIDSDGRYGGLAPPDSW